MARENKLSVWLAINSSADFLLRWNRDASSREALWAEVGYANEGAAYNAARNAGIIPGGPIRNGGDDGDKAPRKPRAKGVLPKAVETWAILSAQADYLLDNDGNSDDFEAPDVTPEWFMNLRAVKNETKAFRKILDRIGGMESDAGKALRQWAGHPLTKEQAGQERAERESAAAATTLAKIAKLLSKAHDLAEIAGLEIGGDLSALMAIHGLTVETETETETETE